MRLRLAHRDRTVVVEPLAQRDVRRRGSAVALRHPPPWARLSRVLCHEGRICDSAQRIPRRIRICIGRAPVFLHAHVSTVAGPPRIPSLRSLTRGRRGCLYIRQHPPWPSAQIGPYASCSSHGSRPSLYLMPARLSWGTEHTRAFPEVCGTGRTDSCPYTPGSSNNRSSNGIRYGHVAACRHALFTQLVWVLHNWGITGRFGRQEHA